MGITVEYVAYQDDTDADVRLYEELCAGLQMPVPDLGRAAADRPAWTVVARRPDGRLLGWAEIHPPAAGGDAADVQWLLVSRERERLTTGVHARRAPTAEERETAGRLLRGAARRAAADGIPALEWTGTDGYGVAADLGAGAKEEPGGRWTTPVPLADWQRPAGLPRVTVRQVTVPAAAGLLAEHARLYAEVTGRPYTPRDAAEVLRDLPPLPHLTLDLLTPAGRTAAQVTAVIAGTDALVDVVFRGAAADGPAVAGLIAELAARLRRDHPRATLLEVQEHGDPVTAEALAAAGLRPAERWYRYRLEL
ncbi:MULTISPECIES: hypothetical protein [Streptomyces]|uniref:hypothetical protein n=1 Tax=Streptomyces TaxID=1883 RepID=UPI00163C3D4B|nr:MULTISPECIES: hypothetical protein [Streptomyces]MBC2878723.1 hypothetical protein [Streptomyces sp. TYQ1024]UBI35166.1 hypothetical protein K7I03_00985 [Streptomyces mobaraensis]UKW27758.1 hypothetical protein MCU78_01025 [Streptomyces sp. TYQ1024]